MADALLLTVEQAAEMLGAGRTTVYQKVATGEITSFRIGRSRRIPASALAAYVERLVSEQTGKPAA